MRRRSRCGRNRCIEYWSSPSGYRPSAMMPGSQPDQSRPERSASIASASVETLAARGRAASGLASARPGSAPPRPDARAGVERLAGCRACRVGVDDESTDRCARHSCGRLWNRSAASARLGAAASLFMPSLISLTLNAPVLQLGRARRMTMLSSGAYHRSRHVVLITLGSVPTFNRLRRRNWHTLRIQLRQTPTHVFRADPRIALAERGPPSIAAR